jgi:hypothetical protein
MSRDNETLVSNLKHALYSANLVTEPPGDALGSVAYGTAMALAELARSDQGRVKVTGTLNAMRATAARDGNPEALVLLAIRILEASLSQE